MEDKIRKCCPNCCQLYQLNHQSSGLKGNLPLFISCGHTICENCLRSLTKFQEPIECKICLRSMDIKAGDVLALAQDKSKLYEMFPVNHQLLGELTIQLMQKPKDITQKQLEEYYIDLQAILTQNENKKDNCVECLQLTAKMCQQCDTALCVTCFNKTHKNFVIFKNHSLQKIAATTPEANNNNCKVHENKNLDYYCKDCKKSVCMDCLLVGSDKSCKEHNLMSTSEINDSHMEQIINILPKVDETFRRLSKTAVDIGNLLYNIENDADPKSELTKMIADIEQHFSMLCAVVQKHKKNTIEIVTKIKSSEKESLLKAKEDIYKALKKSKKVMKMINSTADSTMIKQMNLSVLLDDATKIAEGPWYLMKEEDKNNVLKMRVNENLKELISDFIHLEGNATSVYKLRSRDELGEDVEIPPPPPTPVFPPQLPQDVRQLKKPKDSTAKTIEKEPKPIEDIQRPMTFFKQAPSYRSKSASVNSLNSCSSGDSSKLSYTQCDGYHSVSQVKPYMERQEPKQIFEGDQDLIYMSHIVDPHNFYVQRASDQKVVKDLLREFRNAVSLPKPLLANVTEGKKYLAFNKVDNLWQRCTVIGTDKKDINQPKFVVFCFDFGSIETVSINNLRLLPPTRWHTPPPLAMNCSLANCEPIKGHWTSDDAILIQNIIDNKQAVIHVRRIIPISENNFKLDCDVTTYEQKVSLAHALVFHERARMPNLKLRYFPINNVGENPKIIISNTDFKPLAIDEIYFTHIVSPDKFFVRKRQHQDDYIKMCEELNQEYSLSLDTGKIYLPEIGMACVVNTEKCRNSGVEASSIMGEDCVWARAAVTEIGVRGRVRVHLVDSGSHLFVHWTTLRAIQPRFTTLRALATECHLAGITPLNKKWSPASVALLQKYQNHLLEMQVNDSHNRNRNSIGVTLFDKSDEENVVCINHEMIKYKFAITVGMFNFNRNHDLKDQAYIHKSPLDVPKKPKRKPDKITILKKDAPIKVNEDDLVAKDKGPLRLEAKVVQCISPSNMYVSLIHQQKTYNEMFNKIQEYYSSNLSKSKTEWNVGDKCCTVCIESQTWRRATIVELENDMAKVFYSDFATLENVQIANLKELAPEFQSMGVAAIKCHLCGIMPAIGDEWPSITKEYLKELLDAYPRTFITKLGNFKDKSMPIEIWVYHTIQGSALEPDKSEWRCLNKKIVEQGLAIPIKSEQVDYAEGNKQDEEETLSFLNVTGSVREWLQLEPMPTKPLPKAEAESASGSSTANDNDDHVDPEHIDFKTPGDIFVSEWLPPEPFQCKEFTAEATFIDNDGVIYLHDIAQQGTLDLIRNALGVRYKDPDPKAKYVKWTVGEPCIALYHFDNNFYRGRVAEVNEVTSNCLVHYIDYGNEEICSFTNMRKSIALHQIPTQAHKCILSRIQPIGKQWEKHTLDYIHRLIVEKKCQVKITGDDIAGITPIDLKYDKLCINDHLVDFELATYISGAKAPVRKYAPPICETSDNTLDAVAAADGDSGPDYIIDEESNSKSDQDSFDFDLSALKGKDWNAIIDEDESVIAGNFHTFLKNPDEEFVCNISLINDLKIFPLSIVHDEDTTMMYDQMFEELQADGDRMPPLNGIFKNKAIIALFEEDEQWYRATILEYSEVKNRIRVRYVDYGNVAVISLADTREIHEEWLNMPPLTVSAKLHGIEVNPNLDVQFVLKEYSDIFSDKGPFNAKVINNDDFIPTVELRDSNNKLVYEKLLENGVFLKSES